MKALLDIPEDDVRWLDVRAKQEGTSRAALVRQAVSVYRAKSETSGIDAAFGLWKDRIDIGDGVEFQRKLRAEWDREWDTPLDDPE